jgi:hypothetical protein
MPELTKEKRMQDGKEFIYLYSKLWVHDSVVWWECHVCGRLVCNTNVRRHLITHANKKEIQP